MSNRIKKYLRQKRQSLDIDDKSNDFDYRWEQEKEQRLKKIKEAHEEIDRIYEENEGQGRDNYKEIESQKLLVQVKGLSLSMSQKYLQSFKKMMPLNVKLNDHALYIILGDRDVRDTLRGEVDSWDLESVVDAYVDDPANMKCCQNLGEITFNRNQVTENGVKDLYCFEMNDKMKQINQCHDDINLLSEWRLKIAQKIMNLYIASQFILLQPVSQNEDKDWNQQSEWGGMCTVGQQQSPINITSEKTYKTLDSLVFDLNNRTDVNPVVNYQVQNTLSGDFGTIHFMTQHEDDTLSKMSFVINQVAFKHQSEHSIDGIFGDAEVVAQGITQDGQEAHFSWILHVTDDAPWNEFLEAIQPEMWHFDKLHSVSLKTQPNMNFLVQGGMEKYYDHSFYLYSGSETLPPCKQGILKFVMANPIFVLDYQIQEIIKKNFDLSKQKTKEKNRVNARNVQIIGQRQVKYYHDKKQRCKFGIPDSIKEKLEQARDDIAHKDQEVVEVTENEIQLVNDETAQALDGDLSNGIQVKKVRFDDLSLTKQEQEILKTGKSVEQLPLDNKKNNREFFQKQAQLKEQQEAKKRDYLNHIKKLHNIKNLPKKDEISEEEAQPESEKIDDMLDRIVGQGIKNDDDYY